MKDTSIKWKEIKTVYSFPDGRKDDVATFCLLLEPEDGGKANAEIMGAHGEYAQRQFALGAVKAVTTARFV